MKKSTLALLALCLSMTAGSAATINSAWTGNASGTEDWNVNGNWSNGAYPNNGVDKYIVSIGDATGDRTIQTAGDITVSRLKITQTTTDTVNTLKLGGNLTVSGSPGNPADSGRVNSTGNASNLVIDLNGYTMLDDSYGDNISATNYTLTGGGTYITRQVYTDTGEIKLGDNVTLKITTRQTSYFTRIKSSPTSSIWYTANNADQMSFYGYGTNQAISNLKIGEATNTVASKLYLPNAIYGVYISGNVDILGFGDSGASAKLDLGATGILVVGGNFIDEGTDSYSYGGKVIGFNGGRAIERTLSTGRQDITTSFQVGDTALTPGNIGLGKDLTTSGNFTVTRESALNVKDFNLSAMNVNIQSSGGVKPTLSFAFGGGEAGLIEATGTLTLSLADVNVEYTGGGWTNGDALTLFEFGALSGTPSLTVNATGFTYDAVVVGANSIYLSNVVIPEPGALALAALGAMSLLIRRKRSRS